MKYHFLIVGSGLFGATCARLLKDRGFSVVVYEARDHLGGNCATEVRDGIVLHRYGPHLFHTNDPRIWKWVNKYAEWRQYQHRVKVYRDGRVWSFPPNLETFQQLWGVTSATQAREKLHAASWPYWHMDAPTNAEDWILSRLGPELYELFYREYTTKQWGRPPSQLPASIVRRIPWRLTWDDRYHSDTYQAVPVKGYTPFIERLLDSVDRELSSPVINSDLRLLHLAAHKVIYTGPLDRLFNYSDGPLEYRSLNFIHSRHETPDYQGCAQMNFTGSEPHTRIIEHRHFQPEGRSGATWTTTEVPIHHNPQAEPYYPIGDEVNLQRHKVYLAKAEAEGLLVGGRLGSYQYLDMHQAVGAAQALVKRLLKEDDEDY